MTAPELKNESHARAAVRATTLRTPFSLSPLRGNWPGLLTICHVPVPYAYL